MISIGMSGAIEAGRRSPRAAYSEDRRLRSRSRKGDGASLSGL